MNARKRPLISEYTKRKQQIPTEKRVSILRNLRTSYLLTAEKIAIVLNVTPQTVRCWFSEKNPRNISTEHLKTLCEFYGKDPFEDF